VGFMLLSSDARKKWPVLPESAMVVMVFVAVVASSEGGPKDEEMFTVSCGATML
jgi:hypothetical protein